MSSGKELKQEELDALEIPVTSGLLNAPTPMEVVREVEREMEDYYRENKDFFKDKEESDYFYMLPVSEEQRSNLMTAFKERRAEKRD